jgi:ABC-type transport system involved in multi-copper enzyme maturation permease subunit
MITAAIARNTFREAVRDRILYSILTFAFLLIGASIILAGLSIGQESKIVKDLGLASSSLFGTFIAIFLGITLVSKEIERRTIYMIVSKPISRPAFLVGKYVGLVVTLAVTVGVMASLVFLLSWVVDGTFTWTLLVAAGVDFVALMIVTAVALLFSTFSTPTLSAIFTMAIFVIGRLSADLAALSEQLADPAMRGLIHITYLILPDLGRFQIGSRVVHGLPLVPAEIGLSVAYGAAYIGFLLLLAMSIFQRRDFK